MHKKHVQINETPYGYTFMHKKHVQINETPYGYTFMHKKHVQINERRAYYAEVFERWQQHIETDNQRYKGPHNMQIASPAKRSLSLCNRYLHIYYL